MEALQSICRKKNTRLFSIIKYSLINYGEVNSID